jgi:hypothetical protein
MIAQVLCVTLLAAAEPATAVGPAAGPPPDYLKRLACRIAVRTPERNPVIRAIADVNLDTMSSRQEDRSFRALLHNGQQLTAVVQHVSTPLPGDRFNVTLLLDGKTHLRLNHMDLDIFAETTIGEQPYLLHCFRDIEDDLIGESEHR